MSKKCVQCLRTFPGHLVNPMVTSEWTIPLCPICSLKIRNKMLGVPEGVPFHGEIANELWEEATEFVRRWKL